MGLAASLLAVALLPLPAADWHVDQAKGADTNPGSADSPLKTVQAAVDKLKPGDTVLIGNGVYRETVSVTVLGTAAEPIAIKAAEGAKPVLSGADEITGWQACTSAEEAGGNPDFAKISWVDLDWEPTALFEAGQKQNISQTPDQGWWPAPQADELSLTDPEKLQGQDIVPEGASLFFFKFKGFAFARRPITSFDKSTGTITVGETLGRGVYTPGSDRYRLENHALYINMPGEWAWRQVDGGKYRVFYLPKDPGALIEIPRRDRIVDLSRTAHCTIEGLEVTMASYPGRVPVSAMLNDVHKHTPGAGEDITIRFCKVHHNGRYGIFGRGYTNLKILNNLIYRNQYGVALAGQTNTLVQHNEIAENLVDGLIISHGSKDIVAKGNFIHHHSQFGHPDNVQFYRDVVNITLEDNFLLASGQGVMMEEVKGAIFRNNVIAGTDANMIIMGHGNADDGKWERNTFALWTSAIFNLTGKNYVMKNNIMANSGGTLMYTIPKEGEFTSEGNLLYQNEGTKYKRMFGKPKGGDEKGNNWFDTLEGMQNNAEQELGSVFMDPKFRNAPAYMYTLNSTKVGECTAELLHYDQKKAPDIAVGDIVEVHFDGVPRKVTASEGGAITIDPPLADVPDRVLFIANWKDKQDFALDFSSPHNKEYGATINTLAYLRGDFDGDGKRDIPER